jgi:hypothetical protein
MTTSIENRRHRNAIQTLDVIKKHFKRYGFTPTQHQIADEIGKSRGAIYPRLQLLAEMGEIHFDLNGQIIMGKKQ